MEDFTTKLDIYEKAKDEIDDYIWDVFYKYIGIENILFSGPNEWSACKSCLHFTGEDGCMGCYDSMSINIPIEFFINPDEEFLKLKKEKEDKEKDAEEYIMTKDRKDFERLKNKHGW